MRTDNPVWCRSHETCWLWEAFDCKKNKGDRQKDYNKFFENVCLKKKCTDIKR